MDSPAKLCVINQKGGVGKTTISINLCGALAARGHDVLLVDSDPQGNATEHLGYQDNYHDLSIEVTLADCLTDLDHIDDIEKTIAETPEFDLVRANEQMHEGLREKLSSVNSSEARLTKCLESVEGKYDYVVIDSPPRLGKITTNGIVYARNLLVPTYPEEMSVTGISRLSRQVDAVQEFYQDVSYVGFVINRIENNNEAEEVIEGLEEEFGSVLSLWKIRKRVDLRRAITKSNGSIFIHDADDEHDLVFFDIAAKLDDYFDLEPDHDLYDVFSEADIRDAVTNGQIEPEDLVQLNDEVSSVLAEGAK